MNKHNNKLNPSKTALIITVSVVALAIIAIVLRFVFATKTGGESNPVDSAVTTVSDVVSDSSDTSEVAETSAAPVTVDAESFSEYVDGYVKEETELTGIDIGNGLTLITVGSYTGEYTEDGTNDHVENCLSAVVMNTGVSDIVTAEVFIEAGDGVDSVASFKVTTLPVGASVTVLEQNRMTWNPDLEYKNATSATVAYFDGGKMNAYTDVLEISGGEGFINVKNIYGKDITGDVIVYYKPVSDGKYLGGITYSARAIGGIPDGQTQTIQTGHFDVNNCRIMFVTLPDGTVE